MKLQDKETLNIAKAVRSVISERKSAWSWDSREIENGMPILSGNPKAVDIHVDFGDHDEADGFTNNGMHYMDPYDLEKSTIGFTDGAVDKKGDYPKSGWFRKSNEEMTKLGFTWTVFSGTKDDLTEFFTNKRARPPEIDKLGSTTIRKALKDIKSAREYKGTWYWTDKDKGKDGKYK